MSEEKMFVDLSGYALTGKSAVTHLLQEFDGFTVPDVEFEFGLFRMKDGLLDLEHSLLNDWSPLRSDAAIRRFMKLVMILGAGYSKYSLRWLSSPSGYNYHKMVHPDFLCISLEYIYSLIEDESRCYWPFQLHDIHSLDCFMQRLRYAFCSEATNKDIKYISFGDDFLIKTQCYLQKLYPKKAKVQVLHNAFEPFRASDVSRYFSQGKSIVVDRDPRAIYAESKESRYSDFSSVSSFVHYFKQTRKKAEQGVLSDNVLLIEFEKIVTEYDATLENIYTFLCVDEKIHSQKGKFFYPDISVKNIDRWKTVLTASEINFIEKAL